MTTKVDGLTGLVGDADGGRDDVLRVRGSVPIGGARSLTDEERQEQAMLTSMLSPVSLLLGAIGWVIDILLKIGYLVTFIALVAAVLGGIAWADFRVVAAWVVGAWILSHGMGLGLFPYMALVARSNADALVIRDEAGHEQIVGWTRRPWLGFVIALPIALVAWLVASVAFHWIMPG